MRSFLIAIYNRLHGGYVAPSCSVNNATGEEVEDSLDILGTEVAGRTPTLFRNAQTMQTFLLRRIRLLVEQ